MIFNPNICACTGVYHRPPCPPSSTSSNCIRLCDLIVNSDDSIWPCGETGQVLFEDKLTLPEGCTPEYSIVSYTPNLTNVQIDPTGITFTSDWDEGENYLLAEIVYKVCCGILSDTAKVYVFFRKGDKLECEDCYEYNPCNGECEEIVPDLEIGEGQVINEIDVSIQ